MSIELENPPGTDGTSGPIAAADIADASSSGRTVLTGTPAQAREAIGVGLNLAFQGSSTTEQGTGASMTAIHADGYSEIAAANLALPGLVAWRKHGVGGTDYLDYSTSAPANIDVHVKTGCTNVLVVQGIKNGPQAGWTTQQTVDRVKSYCAARKAAGWDRVIVALPCFPIYAYATFSTAMLTAIPALLADASLSNGTVADGFIRWDANPDLKNGEDDTSDGLHWNEQGYTKAGRVAAIEIIAALGSAGSGPVTSAISSPSAGSVLSANTPVSFSVGGTIGGYVASLYASVASTVSGGPNEALTLLATASDVTQLTAPISSVPSGVSYLYIFIRDSFGRRGVSAPLVVSKASMPEAPEITTQPTNATINDGEAGSFSVTASGTAPLSYQWEVSADSGSTWSACTAGAVYSNPTTATLGVTASLAMSGNQYRCTVTNTEGAATSNAAALTVSSGITTYLDDQFTSGSMATGRTPDTTGAMAWNVDVGSLAITGGALVASGVCRAIIDSGQANRTLEFPITLSAGTSLSVSIRFGDANNRLMVTASAGGSMLILSRVSSSDTTLGTWAGPIVVGQKYVVKAIAAGSAISVLVDDVERITGVDSLYGAATQITLGAAGGTVDFDYVKVYS